MCGELVKEEHKKSSHIKKSIRLRKTFYATNLIYSTLNQTISGQSYIHK